MKSGKTKEVRGYVKSSKIKKEQISSCSNVQRRKKTGTKRRPEFVGKIGTRGGETIKGRKGGQDPPKRKEEKTNI